MDLKTNTPYLVSPIICIFPIISRAPAPAAGTQSLLWPDNSGSKEKMTSSFFGVIRALQTCSTDHINCNALILAAK
ncbi:unnamed protein product [Coffea canephora]|uniref:Uncharacterized protein n=1 Tax=Coffea canephora TaxID=49390 RepID=A0A068V635_COFCA|nr:unnamed protein product [Coffea canephora]